MAISNHLDHFAGLPVQDFRAMHTHAYTPKRSVSTDRWLLTGESAVFFDPLYSPGSDVIAIANTLLCWLLGKDLRGEDISDLTEIVNTTLNTMGEVALPFWRGAYPVMGDPQTFAYKLLWDNESYFSMIATPWTHTRWTDVNFLLEYLPLAVRFNVLSQQVQSTPVQVLEGAGVRNREEDHRRGR